MEKPPSLFAVSPWCKPAYNRFQVEIIPKKSVEIAVDITAVCLPEQHKTFLRKEAVEEYVVTDGNIFRKHNKCALSNTERAKAAEPTKEACAEICYRLWHSANA